MGKNIVITFWVLIISFLAVLSEIIVPAVREIFAGSITFLIPIIIFALLGVLLLVLAVKQKSRGKLRKYLILTGASAAGFFVCVLLHNLVYGLFIYIFGNGFWDKIGMGDEFLFFLLAIFVCPIVFLVGAIGSIVSLVKNRNASGQAK